MKDHYIITRSEKSEKEKIQKILKLENSNLSEFLRDCIHQKIKEHETNNQGKQGI